MYLAMWFWFIFMIVINTCHVFYRVATLFFDKLRFYQLFKTVYYFAFFFIRIFINLMCILLDSPQI